MKLGYWLYIHVGCYFEQYNTCISQYMYQYNTCIEQYMYMSHQNKSYQQSLEKREISSEHERQY